MAPATVTTPDEVWARARTEVTAAAFGQGERAQELRECLRAELELSLLTRTGAPDLGPGPGPRRGIDRKSVV